MEEIWKDIKDYEGYYQVSNLGRIRSLDRYVNTGIKHSTQVFRRGKLIKPFIDRDGYLVLTLSKNYKLKYFRVHRLVAEAFIENLNDLPYINHKDENKQNNKVDNLEWCTQKYNVNYGTANYRKAVTLGKPVNQYTLDWNFIKTWNTISEASRNINTTAGQIVKCCKGKGNTAGGYKWRYVEDE